MADSSISYVVQKFAELLFKEAVFLKGVREQVQRLRDELRRMQCFLEDADAKQENDKRVRNWVFDIRNVAYDAEDLIDTFILKIECNKRKCFIKRYACIFKEGFHLHDVGKEIKAIQARIDDISRSRETFGICNLGEGTSSIAGESLQQMRRTYPRGVEKDIVGLEEDTAKLVEQLVQKNEARRSVISIVGMGGIGKTTLAKNVYNHRKVRVHFDCHAWAYVSQEYRPRDVLRRLIKELVKTTKGKLEMQEELQEQDLENMLYEHLRGRRYLVVLDDIWSQEVWPSLARAFPDTSNGSRLILTTRNKEVALRADPRSIHEPRFLSNKNSLELFYRKAFIDSVDAKCPPPILDDVGRKIVSKCAGLPLAISVIGGLLSRKKKSLIEWESVLNNIGSHFAGDPKGVSAILALSYNDLPYFLKPCFLHLGHFPEDYVITTRTLFHLWVAEGLISQGDRRMENIAEENLNELINRNMVQVVRISAGERVKECRIHDLLRDLSISKAKEEIRLAVIHGNIDLPPSVETRHQAFHCRLNRYFDSQPSAPHLRSLLFFQPNESIADTSLDFIRKSFKLLRVLDLSDARVFYLPSAIGKLIHLRYLGLQRTYVEKLPSSIRYLRSLQTLDARTRTPSLKIPNLIYKMESLRHLYMSGHLQDYKQLKIDALSHLQTLTKLDVRNWKGNNPEKLTNLRKLGIIVSNDRDGDEFFNSVAKLKCLLSLKLWADCDEEFLPSLTGLSHLYRLTKLYLSGMMRGLPNSHEFPPNLIQLTLEIPRLEQSPMEVLGKLSKLSILRLRKSYIGQTLKFSANHFLQLNFLELKGLSHLEELKVEEGAMPMLRCLQISRCRNLTFPTEGMKFLSALEELEIDGSPREITRQHGTAAPNKT